MNINSPISNFHSENSPFEVAVVTKISPDKNKTKIKMNKNNNNLINNNNSNTLGNKINKASKGGNLNKINNINYGNNKNLKIIINGRIPNKNNKSNSKNKKNQNQKYISPSKLNVPSQHIQKVQSDYNTRTNIVLSHQVLSPNALNNYNNTNIMNNNINILNKNDNNTNLFNQTQNNGNINKLYNQPESEKATVVNDNINNWANKESNQLNNNIDLKNNDFKGSGYIKYYGDCLIQGLIRK